MPMSLPNHLRAVLAVFVPLVTLLVPGMARATAISSVRLSTDAGTDAVVWDDDGGTGLVDVLVIGETLHFDLDGSYSVFPTEPCSYDGSSGITWDSAGGVTTGEIQETTEGVWTLTCGADAYTIEWRDAHPGLYLQHAPNSTDPSDLSGTFNAGFGHSYYFRTLGRQPAYTDTTKPDWVTDTAWQYILDHGVNNLWRADGDSTGAEIGTFSGGWVPASCGASDYPLAQDATDCGCGSLIASGDAASYLDSTLSGNARSYAIKLERLGIAAMLEQSDNATSLEPFNGDGDIYLHAAEDWTDKLVGLHVGTDEWHTVIASDNEDLVHAEWLMALAESYDWLYPHESLKKRREWRTVLYAEAQALEADHVEGSSASHCSGGDTGFCFSTLDEADRRFLRNGHYVELAAALGIVGNVLYYEGDGGTGNDVAHWRTFANGFFLGTNTASPKDGSDDNGTFYNEEILEYTFRWIESQHLNPTADPDNDWLDGSKWVANSAKYLMYTTAASTRRSLKGDGAPADEYGPSYVNALLARLDPDPDAQALDQRLAWDGWNDYFNADFTRRDPLDVLWYDDSIAPLDTPDIAANNQCFPEGGVVSVRSGWDADDVHLLFHAQPEVGGHGHPNAGGYELMAADVPLISEQGAEQQAKRTGADATVLVNGVGQHGDFLKEEKEPYDLGVTTAKLTTYLDATGPASYGGGDYPIQMTVWASSLRGMYKGDGTPPEYSDVETGTDTFDAYKRFVVWLGDPDPDVDGAGAVYVIDRVQDTSNSGWRFDDVLPVRQVCPYGSGDLLRPYHACESVDEPPDTGVPSYTFTDGSSSASYTFDGGGPATVGSVTAADINEGAWWPDLQVEDDPDDTGTSSWACDGTDEAAWISMSSPYKTVDVTPALASGCATVDDSKDWLRARALWGPAFTSTPVPMIAPETGNSIGSALYRTTTTTGGSFITGLLPVVGDDGSGPGAPVGVTVGTFNVPQVSLGIVNKHRVGSLVDDVGYAVFYADLGAGTYHDGLVNTDVAGVMGVVAFVAGSPNQRLAAQMVHASAFTHRGQTLVYAFEGAAISTTPLVVDASVTWNSDGAWGAFQNVTSTASVNRLYIHIPCHAIDHVHIDATTVSPGWGAFTTGSCPSGQYDTVQLNLTEPSGTYSINYTTSTLQPASSCDVGD